MIGGALSGLAAAFLQSLAYIASSHFIQRRREGAGIQLLVLGHLWMGVLSLGALFFVWHPAPSLAPVVAPVVSAALLNIVAQLCLMQAIKYAEPSRVSPLLTIKVFVPALLTTFLGQPVGAVANRFLTPWQWLAVVLCVIAGVSINQTGGRMRPRALLAIFAAALCFAGADWAIGLSIARFEKNPQMTLVRAAVLTEVGLFLSLATVAAVLLPLRGSRRLADWRDSAAFGFTWFGSMVCLFIAFGSVGIVLGTILQCTRGFMTILMGIVLIHLGLEHIEPRQPFPILLRRFLAGLLMFIGITLYILRRPL